jgi:hypothetical protein
MTEDSKNPDVIEGVLSALVNVCIDHESNCRRVLMKGLDTLAKVAKSENNLTSEMERHDAADVERPFADNNPQLAKDLLHLLQPFNWIQCTNCRHKNEAGERCVKCGHKIAFFIA